MRLYMVDPAIGRDTPRWKMMTRHWVSPVAPVGASGVPALDLGLSQETRTRQALAHSCPFSG